MSGEIVVKNRDKKGECFPQHFAAIDLGSRNCRLIIARPQHQGIEQLEVYSKFVCLAEGLAASGKLMKKAMDRAIVVLNGFRKRMDHYADMSYFAVATDAMRRAANSERFLRRILHETGLRIEIISPESEGALAARGCAELLKPDVNYFIVFDIGGGSTEIILCRRGKEQQIHVIKSCSISQGVVNLFEKNNYATFQGYTEIVRDISEQVTRFVNRYLGDHMVGLQVIGASGTTTTVAALKHNLKFYDRDRINGDIVTFEELMKVVKYVQSMTAEERILHPCIGHSKDDLILGGLALFEGILRALPVKDVTVTDYGVRDGIIKALVARTQEGIWLQERAS